MWSWTKKTGLVGALAAGSVTAGAAQEGALELVPHVIHDPMAGCDALRVLAPAGWRVESSIAWRLDSALLAELSLRCSDPAGLRQMEALPLEGFTWAPDWVFAYPRGTMYVGAEMQPPPSSVPQFVVDYVLPRRRKGVGARVSGFQDMPELAAEVAEQQSRRDRVRWTALAGRTRVDYELRGRAAQEDVVCVLLFCVSPYDGRRIGWRTERLYAVRSERGRLDADAPLLDALASSIRMEQDWFNVYAQVGQSWVQIEQQKIRDAGRITRLLAGLQRDMSAERRRMWESWNEGRDRASERFCDAVKGVERYSSPYETYPVELPAGYERAWVDGRGYYVLTQNQDFNPNTDVGGSWRELERVE